jgi:MOSC domain-containing protein YiiM
VIVEGLMARGPVPMYVEGRIVQISVSNGGVPKTAVPEARITEEGVEGDRQRHTEIHGGPDRAVCLF